jgi:hypothetical protein
MARREVGTAALKDPGELRSLAASRRVGVA